MANFYVVKAKQKKKKQKHSNDGRCLRKLQMHSMSAYTKMFKL